MTLAWSNSKAKVLHEALKFNAPPRAQARGTEASRDRGDHCLLLPEPLTPFLTSVMFLVIKDCDQYCPRTGSGQFRIVLPVGDFSKIQKNRQVRSSTRANLYLSVEHLCRVAVSGDMGTFRHR